MLIAVLQTVSDSGFPVKELIAAGGAGIAVLLCALFLRAQDSARKDQNALIEKCNATVEKVSTDFANTIREVQRDSKDSHERCTQALLELAKNNQKP